jgi:hypothetical protein
MRDVSCDDFVRDRADTLMAELVPLAGRMARAAATGDEDEYLASEIAAYELVADLCVCKLRALLILMAGDLHLLGWRGDVPATGPIAIEYREGDQ